jgi:hypothetical protein
MIVSMNFSPERYLKENAQRIDDEYFTGLKSPSDQRVIIEMLKLIYQEQQRTNSLLEEKRG